MTRWKRWSSTRPGACRNRSSPRKCCRFCARIRPISTATASASFFPTARSSNPARSTGIVYGSKIPLSVQQPPSDDNALGEIKFLFPNSHNIYMHDTPTRALFEKPVRAFSHGCVRVENPREFATYVMGLDRSEIDIADRFRREHDGQVEAQAARPSRLFHRLAGRARPHRLL